MSSRRNFVKKTALTVMGIALLPNLSFGAALHSSSKKLKLAFIGVALGGCNHLNNALFRKDVEITAICDVDPDRITIGLQMISDKGFAAPKVFGNSGDDYRNLLALEEVVAVVISTPWPWHTKMAVDAMKAGKYKV
jgi:predicted dehydrogenase